MIGELPQSLTVNGVEHPINTDYRDILKILCAFSDPELDDGRGWARRYVCLRILYKDYDDIPPEHHDEALKAAFRFIDCGIDGGTTPSPRVMDWEQDEQLIFPAINKTAGFEVRSAEYVHWWTFLGWYMNISDGVYAQILSLRLKKAKHKKFEKYETEFWEANKGLCTLRTRLSEAGLEAKERLNRMLG